MACERLAGELTKIHRSSLCSPCSQDVLKDASVAVVFNLLGAVDTDHDFECLVVCGDVEALHWLHAVGDPRDGIDLFPGETETDLRLPFGKLKWQHTHPDEVRTMDALVALRDDGAYAEQ